MSWSVSHRQAGVTRADVQGLVRHEYRDVDKSNGVETKHSNERIVPSRTHLNESWMWVDGKRVGLTKSSQITDELDRRLEGLSATRVNPKTGRKEKRAIRSDAKVVRNIILQLDPAFTRSSAHLLSSESDPALLEEVMRLTDVMIEHYAEVYGEKNLLAASMHWDETSPHLHLMVTPIDDEGRVRQESFIKAGRGKSSGMAKNDAAMRERLAANGYDVDKQPRGLGRGHLSIDAYAAFQQREEMIAALQVEAEDAIAKGTKMQQEAAEASLKAEQQVQAAQDARERFRRAESRTERERASLAERNAELDDKLASVVELTDAYKHGLRVMQAEGIEISPEAIAAKGNIVKKQEHQRALYDLRNEKQPPQQNATETPSLG